MCVWCTVRVCMCEGVWCTVCGVYFFMCLYVCVCLCLCVSMVVCVGAFGVRVWCVCICVRCSVCGVYFARAGVSVCVCVCVSVCVDLFAGTAGWIFEKCTVKNYFVANNTLCQSSDLFIHFVGLQK